jgi:hypothetical protein
MNPAGAGEEAAGGPSCLGEAGGHHAEIVPPRDSTPLEPACSPAHRQLHRRVVAQVLWHRPADHGEDGEHPHGHQRDGQQELEVQQQVVLDCRPAAVDHLVLHLGLHAGGIARRHASGNVGLGCPWGAVRQRGLSFWSHLRGLGPGRPSWAVLHRGQLWRVCTQSRVNIVEGYLVAWIKACKCTYSART